MSRFSPASFAAGVVCALAVSAVPAHALLRPLAIDPHPESVDTTAPVLVVNPLRFDVGSSIDITGAADDICEGPGDHRYHDRIPMTLSWSATDAISGMKDYDLVNSRSSWEGNYNILGTQLKSIGVSGGNYWSDCGGGTALNDEWFIAARDNRGNVAMSTYSGSRLVGVWQEDATMNPPGVSSVSGSVRVAKTSGWSVSRCLCYDAGKTLYSTTKGKSMTYTVISAAPGQALAVVMERNSNRGKASISLNGGAATTVDTYASPAQHGAIVWQTTLPVGTSTVTITNLGTTGRSRVDVDAVLMSDSPGLPPEFAYPSVDD